MSVFGCSGVLLQEMAGCAALLQSRSLPPWSARRFQIRVCQQPRAWEMLDSTDYLQRPRPSGSIRMFHPMPEPAAAAHSRQKD